MPHKLNVTYHPHNGLTLPEAKIKPWVEETIADFKKVIEDGGEDINYNVTIGAELFIHYFRLAAAQGRLDHTQLFFLWYDNGFEYEMDVDKFGTLREWPKDFCEYHNDVLIDLLSIGNEHWKTTKANKDPNKAFKDKDR